MTAKQTTPSWNVVNTKLANFAPAGLPGRLQNRCAASKDNRAFPHVRFALGDDMDELLARLGADAWHRHMALVMLAALFSVKREVAHRETWPMLSLNDLVTAIAHMLP